MNDDFEPKYNVKLTLSEIMMISNSLNNQIQSVTSLHIRNKRIDELKKLGKKFDNIADNCFANEFGNIDFDEEDIV